MGDTSCPKVKNIMVPTWGSKALCVSQDQPEGTENQNWHLQQ